MAQPRGQALRLYPKRAAGPTHVEPEFNRRTCFEVILFASQVESILLPEPVNLRSCNLTVKQKLQACKCRDTGSMHQFRGQFWDASCSRSQCRKRPSRSRSIGIDLLSSSRNIRFCHVCRRGSICSTGIGRSTGTRTRTSPRSCDGQIVSCNSSHHHQYQLQ